MGNMRCHSKQKILTFAKYFGKYQNATSKVMLGRIINRLLKLKVILVIGVFDLVLKTLQPKTITL